MSDSNQKMTGRVRPEIFHIEYEVDTDGAIPKRELAFVMGIMSDLSGDRLNPLDDLTKETRNFVNIDRDNIADIQQKINPHLDLLVKDELRPGSPDPLAVSLDFPDISRFSPVGVINQVKPLAELLKIRQQLAALAARIDGKADATNQIEKLLRKAEQQIAHYVDDNPGAKDQGGNNG